MSVTADSTPSPKPISILSLMLAVFLGSLDQSIANTALPAIAAGLQHTPAESVWVIHAYQLAVVAVLLPLAALGDRWGARKVFLLGVALFNLAALASAYGWRPLFLALAGCATGPDRRDPFEPFNRKVMRFNDGLDREVLEPVAVAYRDMVPRPVRTGVGNVLGNFTDVWSFFNSVLQLKMYQAVDLGVRVGVNTFLGLGGLLARRGHVGVKAHGVDLADAQEGIGVDHVQRSDAGAVQARHGQGQGGGVVGGGGAVGGQEDALEHDVYLSSGWQAFIFRGSGRWRLDACQTKRCRRWTRRPFSAPATGRPGSGRRGRGCGCGACPPPAGAAAGRPRRCG